MTLPQKTVTPTQKKNSSFDRWCLLLAGVIVLILILIFASPDPFMRILLYVKAGIWTTVSLTGISFLLVLLFGLLVALARVSKSKILLDFHSVR